MYSPFAVKIALRSSRGSSDASKRVTLKISRQQQQQQQKFTTSTNDISTSRLPCLLNHQRSSTLNTSRRRPLQSVRSRPQSSYIRSESSKSSSSSSSANSAARNKSTVTPSAHMQQGGEIPEPNWSDALRALREALHAFLLKPRTIPFPRWISPRLYTVTFSECLGHSSFILVAVSYATDDFLMLRSIAVLGSSCMLFFTYFHPHGRVLWLPFKWNVLFIAINSYRIGAVLTQRYAARALNDEMLRLREEHFYVLDLVDFSKLVRLGEMETYEAGDLIVGQGSMNRYIRFIVDGEVECLRDGVKTYILEKGNFVSEAGLHAGLMLPGAVESCCAIVAAGGEDGKRGKVRVMQWDRTKLTEFLKKDYHLRRALKAALSWDIIRKLKGQRIMLSTGQVDDAVKWTEKRNEQNDNRYAAILQNILSHPHHMEQRRKELERYRKFHHIDDEHHEWALSRCGWTHEEFETGQRRLVRRTTEPFDEGDENEWRLRISRIFGQ